MLQNWRAAIHTGAARSRAVAAGVPQLPDITYIATGEGWLYLAAVLDLATRKIVGWVGLGLGLPRFGGHG